MSIAFVIHAIPDEADNLYVDDNKYSLYGDTLLLERIVESCHLMEDLESVFGKDIANKLLNIVIYG